MTSPAVGGTGTDQGAQSAPPESPWHTRSFLWKKENRSPSLSGFRCKGWKVNKIKVSYLLGCTVFVFVFSSCRNGQHISWGLDFCRCVKLSAHNKTWRGDISSPVFLNCNLGFQRELWTVRHSSAWLRRIENSCTSQLKLHGAIRGSPLEVQKWTTRTWRAIASSLTRQLQ